MSRYFLEGPFGGMYLLFGLLSPIVGGVLIVVFLVILWKLMRAHASISNTMEVMAHMLGDVAEELKARRPGYVGSREGPFPDR